MGHGLVYPAFFREATKNFQEYFSQAEVRQRVTNV
jgi:hypothetical protein